MSDAVKKRLSVAEGTSESVRETCSEDYQDTKASLSVFSYVAWALGATFVLYQFVLQSTPSVMIPDLMRDFSIGSTSVGFLSSSFFYTYLAFQVPGGMLVDRFGPRKVLALGVVLCALSCLLFASAHQLWVADCSRLLMGIAASPAFAGALYVIADLFPASLFPLMAGFTETIAMTGVFGGEFYLTRSVMQLGWRNMMLICALFGLILSIAMWLGIQSKAVTTTAESNEAPDREAVSEKKLKQLDVLYIKQLWVVGLFAGFSFALAPAFAGLWSLPYFQLLYGVSRDVSAIMSATIFLGIAVGCPVFGWFAKLLPWKRLMRTICLLNLLILLIVLYLPLPLYVMVVGLFLLGFTSGVYVIAFFCIRLIAPAYARGTAVAIVNALAITIGSLLFQPLIGYLLGIHDAGVLQQGIVVYSIADYHTAFIVLPICSLLAFLVTFWVNVPGSNIA